MTCTLFQSNVASVLEDMHTQADRDDPPLLERAAGMSGAQRNALLSEAFIPVDRDAGRLLYALVRNARPGLTVEFGTSFGISTIYLAAAVRDRGAGMVLTTELNEKKANRATQFIASADLQDYVELRRGDALQTLADLPQEVTVAFLDGMKELYLPVLHLLEPALQPGALEPYLRYVRQPGNGYVSVTVPIGDGIEVSVRS
jgi:predicted O-methyltransferase YrrM